MEKLSLKFWTLFFIACTVVNLYGAIKPAGVFLDQPDSKNLIDGDTKTVTKIKAGKSSFVIQLGILQDIGKIKILLPKLYSLKKFTLYISDDFVQWKPVSENKNIKSDLIEIQSDNITTIFLKFEFESQSDFEIAEVVCYEQKSPPNEIFNVKISDITESSVKVTWKTKIKSQDFFYYQKKYNGALESTVEVNYITNHSVLVAGLVKGSDYTFKIISESPDGTRIESKQYDFKTLGIPLPEFWQLKASAILPFSAKLFYQANVPVSYEIYFGKSPDKLDKIKDDKGLAQQRDIEIPGLSQETAYYYSIYLKDQAGNVIKTPVLSFSTPPNNIALGKKVWGTFNNIDPTIKEKGYGESTQDKITDGSLNYFGGMAISYNADNSDQYAVIDLEKVSDIKRLDIYWWALSFSKDYRIDVSADGKNWKTLKEHLDASQGKDMRSPMGDYLVLHSVPLDTQARFIRLYVAAKAARGTREKKWAPWPNLYLCEIAVIAK